MSRLQSDWRSRMRGREISRHGINIGGIQAFDNSRHLLARVGIACAALSFFKKGAQIVRMLMTSQIGISIIRSAAAKAVTVDTALHLFVFVSYFCQLLTALEQGSFCLGWRFSRYFLLVHKRQRHPIYAERL